MNLRCAGRTANVILFLCIVGGPPFRASSRAKRPADGTPIQTTICDIARRPRYFNRKLVRFRARIQSDGIEHTALVDQTCPMIGIEPSFPTGIAGDPEVRQLHEAVFVAKGAGTEGKLITATFTGVFEWHKGKIPSRTLTVRGLVDLQARFERAK